MNLKLTLILSLSFSVAAMAEFSHSSRCVRDQSVYEMLYPRRKLGPHEEPNSVSFQNLYKRVSLGKSPIHGEGVFAEEDLNPGDLVKLAPVDKKVNDPGLNLEKWVKLFQVDKNGVPNTKMLKENVSIEEISDFCVDYHQNGLTRGNVRFLYIPESDLDDLEVIKPIKKGEELLRFYGFPTWLTFWAQSHAKSILTELNILLEKGDLEPILLEYLFYTQVFNSKIFDHIEMLEGQERALDISRSIKFRK